MKSQSVRQIGWIVVLIALLGTLWGCKANALAGVGSQQAASGDPSYIITVSGSGVASATPDIVDIQLGVDSVNTDPNAAIGDNNARMTAIIAAVKALGVADADIQTLSYNMWVEQVYDQNGVPTDQIRYHVSNQLNTRLRDINKAGQLLGDALHAGANTVNSISFGVEDSAALRSQAREAAVRDARARADDLAAGLGVRVGMVRLVSETGGGAAPGPLLMEARADGGNSVPVASGTFNVSVDVQVVFDIIQ